MANTKSWNLFEIPSNRFLCIGWTSKTSIGAAFVPIGINRCGLKMCIVILKNSNTKKFIRIPPRFGLHFSSTQTFYTKCLNEKQKKMTRIF